MLSTSDRYKQFVYARDVARHFLPEAVIKIVDVNAISSSTYVLFETLDISRPEQLTDEVFYSDIGLATCEHNHTILNDGYTPVPAEIPVECQIGLISKAVSNSSGVFDPPLVIECEYAQTVNLVGKSIAFNNTSLSVPKDFDIALYHDDELLDVIEVRNNKEHMYTIIKGTMNVNKAVYTFYSMCLPYSRLKILEDIHGVYVQYTDKDVIYIAYNTSVDLLSRQIVAGEMDIEVKNDDKLLSIFNDTGIQAYLQRRQVIEVFLNMIFPEGLQEKILLGRLNITGWDDNSKMLSATFTARDAFDRLRGDYYKGLLYDTPTSMYSIAQDIFEDAGITDYWIDPVLMNIYTYGIVPECSHKEALRYVAQASRSVVVTSNTGTIKIVFVGIPEQWYTEQDTLTDTVLFDYPDIKLLDAVKQVSTEVYSYTVEEQESEIHKSIRKVGGQETVKISLGTPAKECSITVSEGSVGNIFYYANKIVADIIAGTEAEPIDVTITVTGKRINTEKTTYTVDNKLDPNLIPDALEEKIDNPLITDTGVAKDVTEYAVFWFSRRHEYNYEWRQNPAVETMDKLKVYDEFGKNNVVVCTEQNIIYSGGTLEGSSKAIY